MRLLAFLFAFLTIAATVVVVGEVVGRRSMEPAPVDRIAYADRDGRVWTISADGTDQRRVDSGNGFFTWPTWSPDGRRIALSGVVTDLTGKKRAVLLDLDTGTGEANRLHLGEPGVTTLVAADAPHYVSWSPDGERVAFIGATGGGLRLYLDDLSDGDGPQGVLDDAPLYLAWSKDSARVLVHRGAEHLMVDAITRSAAPIGVPTAGIYYRVPAWGPSGRDFNYVALSGRLRWTLMSADSDGDRAALVDPVPFGAAFLWSPNGRILALSDSERIDFFPPLGVRRYRSIGLYDADGVKLPHQIEGAVAFFWSPDSTELAYLTLGEILGTLRLMVLDANSGARWPIVEFVPTARQLTVYQFFDQFAASHLMWSPDSDKLVFSGRILSQAVSAAFGQQTVDSIIVADADGLSEPAAVAEGLLGFWSPR